MIQGKEKKSYYLVHTFLDSIDDLHLGDDTIMREVLE